MKKYILFEFDDYYPSGGLGDKAADSDDLEELKAQVGCFDNAYIVDRDTWQTVWDQDEPKVCQGQYLASRYVDGATIIELMDAYEHLLQSNKNLENSEPYCWNGWLTISMDVPNSGTCGIVNFTLAVGDKSEADHD